MYTAQTAGKSGEGAADLERLDDTSPLLAEGQIVVSLPTWENFDQATASTRHSPISGFTVEVQTLLSRVDLRTDRRMSTQIQHSRWCGNGQVIYFTKVCLDL